MDSKCLKMNNNQLNVTFNNKHKNLTTLRKNGDLDFDNFHCSFMDIKVKPICISR